MGPVAGGDGLDVDRLVPDIALLLGIVEVKFHIRGGHSGDGGGGGVCGGGRDAERASAVDGGLNSERGGLVAVDGSVDAV